MTKKARRAKSKKSYNSHAGKTSAERFWDGAILHILVR